MSIYWPWFVVAWIVGGTGILCVAMAAVNAVVFHSTSRKNIAMLLFGMGCAAIAYFCAWVWVITTHF